MAQTVSKSLPTTVLMTMPVSERMRSMPVRAVVGCPHNRCKFCFLFRGESVSKFSVLPLEETKCDVLALKDFYLSCILPRGRNPNIFIGDGDAMALPPQHFLELLRFLRENIPNLERVIVYAGVRSILNKKDRLKALREAGLTDAYIGFETGLDSLLQFNIKGVSAEENIAAARYLSESGIAIHAMVISGLGGVDHSKEHALATTEMLNIIQPHSLVITRLDICNLDTNDAYTQMIEEGTFRPLPDELLVLEELEIVRALKDGIGRRFFVAGGVACCGEHFETSSRELFIAKLEYMLGLVRSGVSLIHAFSPY